MKKTVFTLIAIITYCLQVSGQNNYVTLHEDCNYKGRRSILQAGIYKNYQMKMANDNLSSIQIPNGMKVTIYEHDDFKGKSKTFTSNVSCLDNEWNDQTSSMVIENMAYQPGFNQSDYITFYNDCYNKGYSKSLKPGTYSARSLGLLKQNISSFAIHGNLILKVYLNNDNTSGYSYSFDKSEDCLSKNFNDKISSLVIEYNNNQSTNDNNNSVGSAYATIYTDCNYKGNSLRLAPGYYQGDKLGLLKYDISAIEIPSTLKAKVYVNNENLSGTYYTLKENMSCLTNTLNNRIGSLIIEESGLQSNNNTTNESGITIYADGNYQGQSVSLLPGTYNTMAEIGFPDKALSSLTVPPGYRVVLYDSENFQGKKYTVTSSKSSFIFTKWNDNTSSIAVYKDR